MHASQRHLLSEGFANPIVDAAFRHIMSDDEIAKSLINSIIPGFQGNPVTEIKRAPDRVSLSPRRDAFMDFHAKTQNGASVIIEMQARCHAMFDERALYYAAYTYSHQLAEGALKESSWYKALKPVYAVQFLDYDTGRVQGIRSKEGEEDLDGPFREEVRAHPMADDTFTKHYVMTDQNTQQKIERGMHIIQIELPRATNIKKLSPLDDSFVERSQRFSLSEWWYCVLKHAEAFDVADLGDCYGNRRGKFIHIPEKIYNACRKLKREEWGPELRDIYARDTLDVMEYGTALAVERHEGYQAGRIEGFIDEFISIGKLAQRSHRQLKQNLPSEDLIRKIWNEREMEKVDPAEAGSEGEEDVPEGRTLNDFVTYLKGEKLIIPRKED